MDKICFPIIAHSEHRDSMGVFMKNNPVISTITGVILIGLAGGVVGVLLWALTKLCKLISDENTLATILAAPLILFLAYLVGYGFLENRSKANPRR